jgi:hypothetical protein
MLYRFSYEGNTPSKKNQKRIFRRKDGAPFITASSDFKMWHKEALWRMKLQISRYPGAPFPLQRCKHVLARLYYKDHRPRDNSNTFESIMDLLVDSGVLADDTWRVTGPTYQFPALRPDAHGGPGWEVCIETYEPAPGLAQAHQTALSPEAPRA